VAYGCENPSSLQIASSRDGTSWNSMSFPKKSLSLEDFELTSFKENLCLAYIDKGAIKLVFSKDGKSWTSETDPCTLNAKRLSVTEFNDKLYLAYATTNQNGDIYVTCSDNGQDWSPSNGQKTTWGTHDSLKLIPFKNKLILAHIHTQGNSIEIGSSSDGKQWPLDTHFPTNLPRKQLSMQPFKDELQITYDLNSNGNGPSTTQHMIKSTDGKKWVTSKL